MRNNLFLIQLLFIATVWLSSCGRKTAATLDGGDTVAFRYAKRLTVVRHDGYTEVTLVNPWHEGKVLHRYVLVPRGSELPAHMPTATVIRTPLQRSIVFTTVHCALLQMLHQERHIAGVADLKYIKIPYVHQMVSRGKMIDVGDGMSPVIERIIDLQPDAILLSPFENSGGYGRLEELGTPLIECADYMETSALGRAEWMRFYGLLYGRQATADSLFAVVERNYLSLSRRAKAAKPRRSILTEKLTGNTWYVAGGKSSVGQLIADAGGSYAWSADNHSGSLALPFETVLDRAGDADVWVFNDLSPQLTYQRLLSEYHGYGQLRAFREHNVWYVNSLQVPYFEQVSFRPDWLLRDYVILLHPELKDLGTPRYYRTVDRQI